MIQEQNPIDELFRNSLADAGLTPPTGVWEAVSSAAPAAASSGVVAIVVKSVWTWITLASIGIGAIVLNNNTGSPAVANVIASEVTKEMPLPGKVSASETPVVNAAKKASDKADQVPAADKKAVGKIDQEPKTTVLKATGTDAVKPENNDGKVALVVTPVPVKQENAAVKVPCGKQLKVSVTKEPNGNAWVFNLNGVQPGAYVQWNFGDGQIASGNMLKHEYPDANDEYSVKAIAWLPPACMDSGVYTIRTRQQFTGISIPDVFTPNGDGINDNLVITVPATAYYNLIVSDKKGKQVFVSNNPETRWNGRCGSQDCESGMYRVTLVYKVPEALQAKSISKMVMLQRGQP